MFAFGGLAQFGEVQFAGNLYGTTDYGGARTSWVVSVNWWKSSWRQPSTSEQLTI
jgi:hypothetical protein